mmetsp:Transcript_4219/g.8457  ORF Transcript_4219/g.8457 Transcript_4219/m.8457 type:complete len:257 (+) Transcript_4219:1037-1807(+)
MVSSSCFGMTFLYLFSTILNDLLKLAGILFFLASPPHIPIAEQTAGAGVLSIISKICGKYSRTASLHCSTTTDVPPIILFSFSTSSVGPASKLVPVSAMAWQLPEQNSSEPATDIPSIPNCQNPLLVTFAHVCSPTKCFGSTPPKIISPPCISSSSRFNQKLNTGSSISPCSSMFWNGGCTLPTDISGNPIPMIPSKDAAIKDKLGSFTASANTCFSTSKSPIWRVSCEKKPSKDPLPYSIENSRPSSWYVLDFSA